MKIPSRKITPARILPRPVIKVGAVGLIVLVCLVVVGAVYIWLSGRNNGFVESATTTVNNKNVLPKPIKAAPGTNVGVAVQSLSSPVAPGDLVYLTVRTLPDAKCAIKVEYNKIPAVDDGLVTKTADEYGMVDWRWRIANSAPVGKWPAEVTCGYYDKTGVVHADLTIE